MVLPSKEDVPEFKPSVSVLRSNKHTYCEQSSLTRTVFVLSHCSLRFAPRKPILPIQTRRMKSLLTFLLVLSIALFASAQDPKSAVKGVTYGEGASAEGAIPISKASDQISEKDKFTGKVKGKVVSVCQEKGCWMKIERQTGEPVMVKFKDYGFFMPKDIVGKEVVLDGEATVKETSVKQLKHYAADAGKSKEEIEKIKQPKKEIIFVAKGVLVL